MTKCATSLAIRKVKMKFTIRYRYKSIRMAKMKKADHTLEHSYITEGNTNWYSHFRKQFANFLTMNTYNMTHQSHTYVFLPNRNENSFAQNPIHKCL